VREVVGGCFWLKAASALDLGDGLYSWMAELESEVLFGSFLLGGHRLPAAWTDDAAQLSQSSEPGPQCTIPAQPYHGSQIAQ